MAKAMVRAATGRLDGFHGRYVFSVPPGLSGRMRLGDWLSERWR